MALALVLAAASAKPSNVVFLLTDDLDLMLGGMKPLKKLHKLLTEQGTTFENAFVHTPICCPSRSTYLSGNYIHNHGAVNNSVDGNCAGAEWAKDHEKKTFAVYAESAGYQTSYAGKYLNQYALPPSPDCPTRGAPGCCARAPPGWTHFFGLVGNSQYYNYSVCADKAEVFHGDVYADDYFPDLVANRTLAMIEKMYALLVVVVLVVLVVLVLLLVLLLVALVVMVLIC